jgi:hypothetical protein
MGVLCVCISPDKLGCSTVSFSQFTFNERAPLAIFHVLEFKCVGTCALLRLLARVLSPLTSVQRSVMDQVCHCFVAVLHTRVLLASAQTCSLIPVYNQRRPAGGGDVHGMVSYTHSAPSLSIIPLTSRQVLLC